MKTYQQFKAASTLSDWLATKGMHMAGNMRTSSGSINQIGQAASMGSSIGSVMGLGSGPATEEEELEWDRTPEKAMIPGIAGMRVERRLKRQLVNDEGENPHYWSQRFGSIAPTLLLTGAGAALGAMNPPSSFFGTPMEGVDMRHQRMAGATVGALGGLGVAGLVALAASLLAAATRTRTKEEQKAYANTSAVPEWLVPGMSTYNYWKTLGRSIKDSDERIAKDKKQKRQEAKP